MTAKRNRPSVLYRPALTADGDQWFALYGEDAQSGVAAFGKTPAKAMKAFDKAWVKLKPPKGGPPPIADKRRRASKRPVNGAAKKVA